MEIDPLSHDERVTVIGITNSGKSYFTKHTLIPQSGYGRVLVWDPHAEYHRDGVTSERFDAHEFEAFLRRFKGVPDGVKISYVPADWESVDAMEDEISGFYRLCKTYLNGTLIVLDELGLFEESGRAQAKVNQFATQSRHWICPLVMVAQCAVQIPKVARRQSHRVYSFRQIDDADCRSMRMFFGERVSRLPGLKRGECLAYESADANAPSQSELPLE